MITRFRWRSPIIPRLCVVIILVLSTSCAQQNTKLGEKNSNTEILYDTISHLNINDPSIDLIKNIKIGDIRFKGINGYACFTPGVTEKEQILVEHSGIHCLEGTSDAIESTEHGALIKIASEYAKKYNRQLVKALLQNEP